MEATLPTTRTPSTMLWTGRILSTIVVLFMLMDSSFKLIEHPMVLKTTAEIGWPVGLARPLGVLLLVCTAVYVFPRTSVLGAILLTAYLGGAVATHLRIGSPLFSHVLFGVYLGVMLWAGLFLRDERLRALIPLRR